MYQPIISVKDKRFSTYRLSQYCLLISIGDSTLKIFGIDCESNRCLLLEVYQLEAASSLNYLAILKQFFRENSFITESTWKKVTICFENQQYTLVPVSLFQKENKEDYLKLSVNIGSQLVQYCIHTEVGIVVVFAIEAAIFNWLQTVYKTNSYCIVHQATSFIASTIAYVHAKKIPPFPKLLVLVERKYIHITAIENTQLLYYNRFSYNSPREFVQYILIVMKSLELDPHLYELILTGTIIKGSLMYKEICKYVRYVSIVRQLPYLNSSSVFKKELMVNYFDVVSFYPATDYLTKLMFS